MTNPPPSLTNLLSAPQLHHPYHRVTHAYRLSSLYHTMPTGNAHSLQGDEAVPDDDADDDAGWEEEEDGAWDERSGSRLVKWAALKVSRQIVV